jgi:opacity protein-like surface antigen
MIPMRTPALFLAALGCCAALASPAAAQESAPQVQPQLWLNAGLFSYHFNRDRDYRERNWGLGAEAIVAPDHVLLLGTYLNSDNARSHYAGYQWRPLHWQPLGVNVSAGLAVTAIDGYATTNNGDWFLAPIPTLAIEGRRFGVNLILVPNFKHGAALAAQLKLKVW